MDSEQTNISRSQSTRQRQSRHKLQGGMSIITPCNRGRAARSLEYSAHTLEIAAEQQISHQQICHAVANPIKRTFDHKLRGAMHRWHVATSETVLCTSWLRCSSPLRVTGDMDRRFVTADGSTRRLQTADPYINHGNSFIY